MDAVHIKPSPVGEQNGTMVINYSLMVYETQTVTESANFEPSPVGEGVVPPTYCNYNNSKCGATDEVVSVERVSIQARPHQSRQQSLADK